jgi:hypothetical protein
MMMNRHTELWITNVSPSCLAFGKNKISVLEQGAPSAPGEPNFTAKPSKSTEFSQKSRILKYFQEIPRKSKQKKSR